MALFGMDVSKFNTSVNYKAARLAGIRFAMVKASQGHALTSNHYLFKDSLFEKHIAGFYDAGIPVGAYHFFTASNIAEALREAEFFIETVEPYRNKISLYLACDAENYGNKYLLGLSKAELSFLVNSFCDRVKKAGFKPCHYTNTDHIKNYIDLEKINYPVWQAHYISGGSVSRPTQAGKTLAIHQYTSSGQLPGVVGKYDLNFGYGPTARLIVDALTPLEPKTLDYIQSFETGDEIMIKLADKLVERSLNPIKIPTSEKLTALIRYHCGLTQSETVHLNNYRWAEELFYKLYTAMVKE